jgi:hypothetical protein
MKVARVGDPASGNCSKHNGASVTGVIESSTNSIVTCHDGKIVAVEGDIIKFSCGHTGKIKSGSGASKVTIAGVPVAVKDSVVEGDVNGKIDDGSGQLTIS